MMTREEFEDARRLDAQEMSEDAWLHELVLDVLTNSDYYGWFHQMTWMGEPSLQFSQDLFAIQELMFRLQPRFVIELGTGWGGSLLFYASMMELVGGSEVLGIDVYMPQDLRDRLMGKGAISNRLLLREGSSTADDTLEWVTNIVGDEKRNLVILDSAHNHQHVLEELEQYAPFIGPGYYMICGDTIIEEMPPQLHRPRPWGPGNSPRTALDEFLAGHPEFESDSELENKLLITCNPKGYLRRCEPIT